MKQVVLPVLFLADRSAMDLTAEKLKSTVDSFGDSAENIAEYMRKGNIKGPAIRSYECPLSQAIIKVLEIDRTKYTVGSSYECIAITSREVSKDLKPIFHLQIETSDAAAKFMALHDCGKLPGLLPEKVEEKKEDK